jgi:nucleotidyltransferase AbiEii toxin of type IV toxin-antitoxin system
MAVDRDFYLARMYPLQNRVLARLATLETGFYLTGGTAASRAYLHHRFSDDLDFFVNDDGRFGLWAQRVVQALAASADWNVAVTLQEARFVRATVSQPDILLKIEMVNDVPAHIGELTRDPTLGLVDSAPNILANKLTAVVDRREPRDLADIWGFCCRLGLSCEAALESAQSKAAGLFPADIARVLLGAAEDDWRLVRWQEAPPASEFIGDLRALGERLLLLPGPG